MKRRVFLGLVPILLLFAGMGLYAVVLFRSLGRKVELTMRENYRSVVAAQRMKDSLRRMDLGTILVQLGQPVQGKRQFEDDLPGFERNLELEEHNITLPGEQQLAEGLRHDLEQYKRSIATYWDLEDVSRQRNYYLETLFPLTNSLQELAEKVVEINQANMVLENQETRQLSATSVRYLSIVVVAGVSSSILLSFFLQRSIVRSLRSLNEGAKALGEGNLDQLVPVSSGDEVGQLAATFNKLAGKLRAYRQVTTDQVLQARQLTEVTLSAFPDPIIACNRDQEIEMANPAAEKLLNSLNGRIPAMLTMEISRVLTGGPDYLPTSFSKAISLNLDLERFYLPRILGMRDERGELLGVTMVLQDVTRFRLMDEVKTNLVSTVSHELKTPLTSVRMGLHLLLDEQIGSLNQKQTELLLAAREDSERLLRIINDLLDLARLESDGARRDLKRMVPRLLLEAVSEDLEPMVESHDCKLVLKVDEGLPQVEVDPRQIHHVFSNLVSNSAKHSKAGEVITMEARHHERGVRFAVVDHAEGIPKEYQTRIFERFFRIPGTEQGGVGLGLAIAQEIVTSHGGSLRLKSQPGGGSEFFFDLPGAGIHQ